MRINLNTLREDIRRMGIVLATAGLLSAFLDGADPRVASGLALAGAVTLLLGNLER